MIKRNRHTPSTEILLFVLLTIFISMVVCEKKGNHDLEAHYPKIVKRIVEALQPSRGENVLIRYDPSLMAGLPERLSTSLQEEGVSVTTLQYGPADDFETILNETDIYIWLPAGANAARPPDQMQALHDWLVDGRGRQIHFHWGDGTRGLDGLNLPHSAAYDSVYLEALDIDYAALDRVQDLAIEKLRSGEVRVTTPAGTDIRFQIGTRPVTKQNGDASKAATDTARAIIGREIELPAGVIRVAPIEESVSGQIVLPAARFGGSTVQDLKLRFEKGEIVDISAASREEAFRTELTQSPALRYFRELGIGFNPKLKKPEGKEAIPYYGYGAGIVRLSLGNNEELGGAVRGEGVRWLLFDNATVSVGEAVVVRDGQLEIDE